MKMQWYCWTWWPKSYPNLSKTGNYLSWEVESENHSVWETNLAAACGLARPPELPIHWVVQMTWVAWKPNALILCKTIHWQSWQPLHQSSVGHIPCLGDRVYQQSPSSWNPIKSSHPSGISIRRNSCKSKTWKWCGTSKSYHAYTILHACQGVSQTDQLADLGLWAV